jgi:hypothetical protein
MAARWRGAQAKGSSLSHESHAMNRIKVYILAAGAQRSLRPRFPSAAQSRRGAGGVPQARPKRVPAARLSPRAMFLSLACGLTALTILAGHGGLLAQPAGHGAGTVHAAWR